MYNLQLMSCFRNKLYVVCVVSATNILMSQGLDSDFLDKCMGGLRLAELAFRVQITQELISK